MKLAIVLLFTVMAVACSSDPFGGGPDLSHVKPGYYGGDGTSQEKAVIAVGLDYSAQAWIAKRYPGSTIKEVGLVWPPKGTKRYDVYTVKKADGKVVEVWFQLVGGLSDMQTG